MTVFSLLKGAFIFTSMLGLIGISLGVWKIWSAYDFSRNAEVKQGVFRGYYTARYQSTSRDSSGLKNQTYTQPSYGDEAILYGQTDVVLLIRKHNGLFKAPAAFVALASNDEEALRTALEDPSASSRTFLGLTLERLAEKIGRNDLLKEIRGSE